MNLKYISQLCELYHFFMSNGYIALAEAMVKRIEQEEHANSVLQEYQNIVDNHILGI